jgi:hypothetical protein
VTIAERRVVFWRVTLRLLEVIRAEKNYDPRR